MRVHLLFWIILINAAKNCIRNSVFRWSQRRAKQFATQHSKASVRQQHVQVLPWSCYPAGFADLGEGFITWAHLRWYEAAL